MPQSIPATYGALLIGAFLGILLSGVLAAQVVVYIKIYRKDLKLLKTLVLLIWAGDLLHSAFVVASVWDYCIKHFGQLSRIDHIPWTLPVTIVFTAAITLAVHFFFVYRIYKLSKHNLWLTVPISILVVCRLCSACVTLATMIRLKSFHLFLDKFRWVFTLGLSLSTTIDICITASLFYYLGMNRTISANLDAVIDSLLLYALENGALTCAATILSTICWLVMPHNLIFMGVHFVIGKLYANSLLLALNTREQIRMKSMSKGPRQLQLGKGHSKNISRSTSGRSDEPVETIEDSDVPKLRVNVNVTKSTHYGWDSPDLEYKNVPVPDPPNGAREVNFDVEKQVETALSSPPPISETISPTSDEWPGSGGSMRTLDEDAG